MDEKMRILKMVEEGKLSAEQAINLMDAWGETAPEEGSARDAAASGIPSSNLQSTIPYEDQMLRVIVDSPQGDKVNVQLPVKIIRQVLNVTGKLPMLSEKLQGLDLDSLAASILECLHAETLGNLVEVESADGTTVKVFIG